MKRFLTLSLLLIFIIGIHAEHNDYVSPIDSLIADNSKNEGDVFYYNQQSKNIIIAADSLIGNAVLIVYNISGLIVVQRKIKGSVISLDDIKSGIYLVAIKSNKYSEVKKIFIK